MHGRVWVVHLFCAAAVIAGHEAAFGQAVAGGQIHGVVTDPSGSAVVGAQVTAEQGNSGLHRSTLSGGDGGFVLPNLPVGPYSLQVAAKGFSNYRQAGIVIQVGDNLAVNVSLKVGAVSEAVEVSAGPPWYRPRTPRSPRSSTRGASWTCRSTGASPRS